MTAGFDALRDELGSSRASSIHQGFSMDTSYDEQDMVKVSIERGVYSCLPCQGTVTECHPLNIQDVVCHCPVLI